MKKLSPKLSIMKKISLALIAAVLQVLFLSNAKAGIVEDVIKEKKINISKAEERCRLADELTKIVNGFNKRIEDYYEYHEVCDGEEYEIINGKVFAGIDYKTAQHAKCHNYKVRNFYVFHDSDKKKYYAVSRGFDGMYVIPVDEAIDEGDAHSTVFNGGAVIVKRSEPKGKISYRYIKNCDILIEQKLTNHNQ